MSKKNGETKESAEINQKINLCQNPTPKINKITIK